MASMSLIKSSDFIIYYLKKISYSSYPQVSSIRLIESNIKSTSARIVSLFPDDMIIEYMLDHKQLKELLDPLRNRFETIPTNLTFRLIIKPEHLTGIFHHTTYTNLSKHKTELYFIVNKMTSKSFLSYKAGNVHRTKIFDLFPYKNFNDEMDNIKYSSLVIKINVNQKELISLMFSNSSAFLLGNSSYNDNIKIDMKRDETLNEIISKIEVEYKHYFTIEIIYFFYVYINDGIISYYEMIDFIKKYHDVFEAMITANKEGFIEVMKKIYKYKVKYQFISKSLLLSLIQQYYEEEINELKDNKKKDSNELSTINYQCLFQIEITQFRCYASLTYEELTNNLLRINPQLSSQIIELMFDCCNDCIHYYSFYTKSYYTNLLTLGIYLGNNRYCFLGYPNESMFRKRCWIILEDSKATIDSLIMTNKGKESALNYLSFLLKPTLSLITLQSQSIETRPDKRTQDDKDIISNGIGRVSEWISYQIRKVLNIDYTPSCFFGIINELQGTWSTYHNEKKLLYSRPSQETLYIPLSLLPSNDFQVIDYSYYKQGYLTYSITALLYLSYNISRKTLLSLITIPLNELFNIYTFFRYLPLQVIQDLLKKIISKRQLSNPLIYKLSKLTTLNHYNNIIRNGHIKVEKSAIMKGIMDEYNILEENQAFAIISKSNNPDDPNNLILKGRFLVAKWDPHSLEDCHWITFIKYNTQMLSKQNQTYYKRLSKLVNVIIFSSKGKESPLKKFNTNYKGKDNEFIVFWDERLNEKSQLFKSKADLKQNKQKVNNENGKSKDKNYFNKKGDKCSIDDFIELHFDNKTNKILNQLEYKEKNKTPIEPNSVDDSNYLSLFFPNTLLGKIYDLLLDKRDMYEKSINELTKEHIIKECPIDYKQLSQRLILGNDYDKDMEFYLICIIKSIYVMTYVNRELEQLMEKYGLRSFDELFIGTFRQQRTNLYDSSYTDIINRKLNELIQYAIKVLVKDYIHMKNNHGTLVEYLNSILITTVVLYNVVYDIKVIKHINLCNQARIIDLIENNISIFDKHRPTHNEINEEHFHYEMSNIGFTINNLETNEDHNIQSQTPAKIYDNITQLEYDMDYLQYDSFGQNYCFPYLIFWKYIILLINALNNA